MTSLKIRRHRWGVIAAVLALLIGDAVVAARPGAAAAPSAEATVDRSVARPPADIAGQRNAVAATKNKVLAGQNGNLSIITPQGDLLMYYHNGWEYGDASFTSAGDNGDGWNNFAHVVSFGVNSTYDNMYFAIAHDGRMYGYYWSQYDRKWVNPSGTFLGQGWGNTAKLISAGLNGYAVLYRITTDGKLWWYRYDGIPGVDGSWANSGVGRQIGAGWDSYQYVTSPGGFFYAVRQNGLMDFFLYAAFDNGDPDGWHSGGAPETIGEGWYGGNCGFQTVQTGGHGRAGTVVYAVDGSGRLRYFTHWADHLGHHWNPSSNCGKIIGTGWM